MMEKIYPRTDDMQTVYLNAVIKDSSIEVGDYTIYNDFMSAPRMFEQNNVLYHYPINHERLVIGKFCSIACGAKFLFNCANHTLKSLSTYTFPLFYEDWSLDKSDVASAWDNKGDIIIGNDVWIGGGTIILPGVTIGNNCVIGAGSLVNKSIPANSVAVGNPCRIIRRLEPAVTFRPATVSDIPELKALFCDTVLKVNARDYTLEEVTDWASCGNRPGHWEKLLATLHFIIACDAEGCIVGFSSIRSDGYLHSMFIHKDHQGEGIATALLQRIEAYATEHGIREITSEVSITARPFFERKGYVVEQEQRARANRLQLTNYIMKKQLGKI